MRRWLSLLPVVLAVGIALLAWYLQVLWVTWDHGPPESDEWHHLTKAAFYLRGWQESGFAGLHYRVRLLRTAFPPLVHLGALPAFLAFGGFSSQVAVLSLGPWLALLVLATFGLARRIMDQAGAVVAALMVAAFPLVISLSHKFLLDLSLAALVAASLWALTRSEGLSRPGWAWLSGVLFGLAMMAKFIAGVFLVGAWAWVLAPHVGRLLRRHPLPTCGVLLPLGAGLGWAGWRVAVWLPGWLAHGSQDYVPVMDLLASGLPPRLTVAWHLLGLLSLGLVLLSWRSRSPEVRAVTAAAAGTLVAIYLTGTWYIAHMPQVLAGVASFTAEGGAGEGDPSPTTLRGWLFYPWVLGRVMPRSWMHLLAVGGVVALLHPQVRRRAGPVLGSAIGAFLILNLSTNKEARYILSLAAPISVLALAWTSLLPALPRWLLRGAVVAVSTVLLLGWVAVHRGAWNPPVSVIWKDDRVLSSGTSVPTQYAYPARVGFLDVLRTPDFYAVMPLPREMPFLDRELPFTLTGP